MKTTPAYYENFAGDHKSLPANIKPYRHICLGVTAAIDCLSSATLVIELRKIADTVTVIMTPAADQLFPSKSLAVIGNTRVITDDRTVEWINHTTIAEAVEIFLIAPASANTLGKLAHGLADNFLTTFALCFNKTKILAPSMSEAMWKNQIVQKNFSALMEAGFLSIDPTIGTEVGTLCNQFGAMPKSEKISKFLLELRREANTKDFKSYLQYKAM